MIADREGRLHRHSRCRRERGGATRTTARRSGSSKRNPRSTERWVEYEAPNVTLALVPDAYKRAASTGRCRSARSPSASTTSTPSAERLAAAGVEFLGEHVRLERLQRRRRSRGLDGNGCSSTAATRRSRTAFAPRRRAATSTSSPCRSRIAPGRAVLRRDARARAQPELDGQLGRVRDGERHARARPSGADRASRSSRFPEGRSRSACPTSRPPRRARGSGRRVPAGVIDSGVCHIAPFSDPDGNGLMLHRRYAPFSDGTMP